MYNASGSEMPIAEFNNPDDAKAFEREKNEQLAECVEKCVAQKRVARETVNKRHHFPQAA